MMPIHGSVDDVHTMLGVEEEEYFPPNFKEYIQKEPLSSWRFRDQDKCGLPTFGWVFWSKQDHQTQLDNFADSIGHALQKLIIKEKLRDSLVQFWAATKKSEGRTLLTTQFQPFAFGATTYPKYTRRLCEYRTGMCRDYNNSFYADAESGEEQLGVPGRVFLNQLLESTPEVKLYTLKEYPQRDLALHCQIGSSWVVPVFDHSSHTCVGVLEIVSLERIFLAHSDDQSFLGQVCDIFQEFDLLCFDGYKHSEMQIGDEKKACAFQELKKVLKMVCEIRELPLAMTWVPCSACNDLLRGQPEVVEFHHDKNRFGWLTIFVVVSKFSHLRKGGVAGMVLSPPNMLYCSDITQLSLAEYPLVPYARHCKLRGWFTLCLQSSYTANDIYVLEFFLPKSERYGDNSWTTLRLILGTMEENFRTFKLASGQKLGDLLSVEVMDFQKGRKLHSVQKIRAKGGGVMLQLRQLDQASTGAIHSGTNVVSEDQTNILPSLEASQNGEVTMQLDSSPQPPLDPLNNGQNVVIAERNIITVTSSEERKRKMQREHKGTGVKIKVSLEDILKCEKMSRAEAAENLQVSISTLKRVCRDYGMDRWAPHNIEKLRSFCPSPVEREGEPRATIGTSPVAPGVEPLGSGIVAEGGDGGEGQQQEIGSGAVRRATEEEPRATVGTSPVAPGIEPLGSSIVAGGSVTVGGSSGDASGSGAGGNDIEPNGSPPRDSAKGKGAVVAEEATEIPFREEDILFRPAATAATSSCHRPITKYDVAEHLPNEILAKLLEDNPRVGEIVLKAKEDRARAIEASEAAERAEREQKEREKPLRDMEAEETAGAEAQGPRVTVVAEAGRLRRPAFSAEAYMPPTPHLFVPSGFAPYVPQQTEYDDELVLRDPTSHIAGTWPEVWLDAHFSYTPTIEEEETINKCMQDGSFLGEFVDGRWISTETVMEYSEMLDRYLSHCCFFCPNVIKNFKQNKQNGRLLNTILLPKTEKIFFPILRDRHWMLLVIDVKQKRFLWLDSLRCETEKKYSEDFAHFLNHEFVLKILREQNEWPIEYPENTPIQENGNDCGVYMMAFMISLAVGDKLHQLSQAQVQRMRRTICLELKKRDIIPRCPLVDNKFLCIQERKKNEANEKLRKESTAASRDEVFIVSERRKHVKSVDQVPSESSQIPPHQSSSSDLQPLTSQNKNKAQVQTARKQNWSKEEDEALCKAWLRVSEDAANGTDQARAKLWDRVRAEFNNILGYETGRISKGLMHRWAIIQQHVNKYSSSERSIERNPTSGCNAEQSIEAAKDLYYRTNGHQFKWNGCWLILKDTSKWFHHMKEQEGREEKIAQRKKREGTLDVDEIVFPSNPSTPVTPSSVGAPISLDDNISPLNDGPTDLLRPTGRKETKNPRRMKKGDQSEGVNFILSEFSNMRKEQKELVQQEISMAAERERMKIQAKLELERMKIAAKREQDQINFEREIMLKDPSTVTTEEGRAWVIAQQKAIWARVNRGGGIGDGSSGNV